MIDDLKYPPVKDIHIAIANDKDDEWNVYLINKNGAKLENVLISSKGYGELNGEKKSTSILRHHFEELETNSFLLIEPILTDLFELFNEYWVSYYIGKQIYDKKFVFAPGSFIKDNMIDLPLINKRGILHN